MTLPHMCPEGQGQQSWTGQDKGCGKAKTMRARGVQKGTQVTAGPPAQTLTMRNSGSGIWEQCGNTEHFGHSLLGVSPFLPRDCAATKNHQDLIDLKIH